jgi:hypothetical protein
MKTLVKEIWKLTFLLFISSLSINTFCQFTTQNGYPQAKAYSGTGVSAGIKLTQVTQSGNDIYAWEIFNHASNHGFCIYDRSSTNPGQGYRLFIDTYGNVGIGTTTPGAKLSFGNMNDGRNTADGITWYSPTPLDYGIYRTSGA